ncbi:hypothetical protein F2Q69_00013535 [Brassica cretica]|uniref:Uncharacterized protein n=1 Tax=Brassica cretica TaxID=69181 RepID=A0A8S9QFI5_BRACR|nr:hypothetical protein F2Q69_00013535 [Brassica cretica]
MLDARRGRFLLCSLDRTHTQEVGLSEFITVPPGLGPIFAQPYEHFWTPLNTPKVFIDNLRRSCPILAQDSISTQHFTTPFLFFKLFQDFRVGVFEAASSLARVRLCHEVTTFVPLKSFMIRSKMLPYLTREAGTNMLMEFKSSYSSWKVEESGLLCICDLVRSCLESF